jgi:hypothetical protein
MADEYSEEKRVIMPGTSEAARSLFRRARTSRYKKLALSQSDQSMSALDRIPA